MTASPTVTNPAPVDEALTVAHRALAPFADPTGEDAGTRALVHGALSLIEAAQRSLTEPATD